MKTIINTLNTKQEGLKNKKVLWCPTCNNIINDYDIEFKISSAITTENNSIIVEPMKLSFEGIPCLFNINCQSCNKPMVILDYDIHSIIIELNNKGYQTCYSCSGHKDIMAYISFFNTDDEKITNLKHLVNSFNGGYGSSVLTTEIVGHMFIIRCCNHDVTNKAFKFIASNAIPQYSKKLNSNRT